MQVSPTLSPSPTHGPHHIPGTWARPPDLSGGESHGPFPALALHEADSRSERQEILPDSEHEASPVTNRYLLSHQQGAGHRGTWENALSPCSEEIPATEVHSLAQSHTRWQRQDEDPGLGFLGQILPRLTPCSQLLKDGGAVLLQGLPQ